MECFFDIYTETYIAMILIMDIGRITYHEKVLIRALFWKTTSPVDVTPSCISRLLWSLNVKGHQVKQTHGLKRKCATIDKGTNDTKAVNLRHVRMLTNGNAALVMYLPLVVYQHMKCTAAYVVRNTVTCEVLKHFTFYLHYDKLHTVQILKYATKIKDNYPQSVWSIHSSELQTCVR